MGRLRCQPNAEALSAGLGAGLEALGGQAVKGARWARNAVRGAEKIAPSGVAPSPGVFLDPAKVGGGIKRRAKDALYSLVDPGDAPAVSGDLPEESMGRWMGFERPRGHRLRRPECR